MNTNRILIFVIILVLTGSVIIIQQYQSIDAVEQLERRAFERTKALEVRRARLQVLAAEKMKQEAIESARRANDELQQVKRQATEQIRKVQADTRQKVETIKAQVETAVEPAPNNP